MKKKAHYTFFCALTRMQHDFAYFFVFSGSQRLKKWEELYIFFFFGKCCTFPYEFLLGNELAENVSSLRV